MKRSSVFVTLVTVVSFFVSYPVFAQTGIRAYYVRADGNDENNNGRSEEAPFKTLAKAIEMTSRGAVKTIVVIGHIYGGWENSYGSSGGGTVSIENSGATEILITGKPGSDETERAVLTNGRQLILSVAGNSKIRLENIELSNSGRGIRIQGNEAIVTLGNGTQIKDCTWIGKREDYVNSDFYSFRVSEDVKGTAISISHGGILVMEGDAIITGCSDTTGRDYYFARGGGVFIEGGSLTMKDNASIVNNGSDIGGGVYITNYGYGRNSIPGTLTMLNNSRITNNMAKTGGGIFSCGSIVLQNSVNISNNSANDGGGIFRVYGELTIKDNVLIQNNTAGNNGGGIFAGATQIGSTLYSPNNETVLLIQGQAKITENIAKNGGGIYISGGKLSITGGEVSKNKAEYGAGIYTDIFSNSFNRGNADFSLSGGSISGNEAEFVGGGVYIATGSTFQQSGRSTITGNIAGDGEGENIFRQ
jgi:predicted outer membrane repeat protein